VDRHSVVMIALPSTGRTAASLSDVTAGELDLSRRHR
jgi:hypothetical protein